MRRLLTISSFAVVLVVAAIADDGGRSHNNGDNNNNHGGAQFQSGMVGSVPGATIGGVQSGGLPWVVKDGEASLSGSGQLQVQVSGLLIANEPGVPVGVIGTVDPVQMVAVSVVCGGSGGSVVASTDGVTLSSRGDAEIDAQITLPATCMAPVVLVRIFNPIGSQVGPFIAVNGINGTSAGQQNGHHNGGN